MAGGRVARSLAARGWRRWWAGGRAGPPAALDGDRGVAGFLEGQGRAARLQCRDGVPHDPSSAPRDPLPQVIVFTGNR